MSMLVRKGTMLHRKNSAPRRSTGRRSSRGSITSNRVSGESSLPQSPRPSTHHERENEQSRGTGTKTLLDISSADIEQRKGFLAALVLELSQAGHERTAQLYSQGLPTKVPSDYNHQRPNGNVNFTSRNSVEYKLSPNNIQGVESYELRRPSSCTSQISGEDRRELYRYSKLNYESRDFGSLASQIREANAESTSGCDFTRKFYAILCNSALATAFFAVLTILPLSMTFLGVKNLQECPLEPHLPVYFLVCGISGLIRVIWALYNQIKSRKHEHFEASFFEEDTLLGSTALKVMEWGLNAFIFVWLVLCTSWTMKLHGSTGPPHFTPTLEEPDGWCSKQLYVFSVAHLYFIYGLFLFFSFLSIFTSLIFFIQNYFGK